MLEAVIRPFQSTRPFNRTRIVATRTKDAVETAVLRFGAAGDIPVPQKVDAAADPSYGFVIRKGKDTYREVVRSTEQIRVEQEDNADNYVIIDRAKKSTFDKQKDPADKTATGNGKSYFDTNVSYDANGNPVYQNFSTKDASIELVYYYPPPSNGASPVTVIRG